MQPAAPPRLTDPEQWRIVSLPPRWQRTTERESGLAYFQVMILPVEEDRRAAYLDFATMTAGFVAEHGGERSVECWQDDVPTGSVTDMRRATAAKEGEVIVFAWIRWPDRATCEAAWPAIMTDDRMKPGAPMPFDGTRLIYGSFETAFDSGGERAFGYCDALVASVADGERQRFVDHAGALAGLFVEQGALRVVDTWGVDVPAGKVTDYRRAVEASDGETIVVGWIEWPDKPTRDAGMAALMADEGMRAATPPWDGKLAIFGGFVPLLDTAGA